MSKISMNWKPYPENIPLEEKEYIVTVEYPFYGFEKYVTISKFTSFTKTYDENGNCSMLPAWHDLQEGGIHLGVVAFMEKPEPFCERKSKTK